MLVFLLHLVDNYRRFLVMTKIVYKKGNVLDVTQGVLAHACNTEAVMGSGVAKFLAAKYPSAERTYVDFIVEMRTRAQQAFPDGGWADKVRRKVLGTVSYCTISDQLEVANMITQYLEPKFNGAPTSLDAIVSCLISLNAKLSQRAHQGLSTEVHMPLICAVRGGIEWTITEKMIETYVTNASSVTIWILEQEASKFESKGWVYFEPTQNSLI